MRQARQLVAGALTASGHRRWVDAAVLAVSEVVTNAVLHANTDCELSVDISAEAARVSVRDFSPLRPTERHFTEQATTGRGLRLVHRVCADYGVELLGADGKVVWFVVNDEPLPETVPDDDGDLHDLLHEERDDDERDEHDDADDPAAAVHRSSAHLVGAPTDLPSAALEHQAAMLRELYLHQVTHGASTHTPLRLSAAGSAVSAVTASLDAARTLRPSAHRLDLLVQLPGADASPFRDLQDALDTGQALARAGQLLIRPALSEIVTLRDWYCEQVVAQAVDVPALGWGTTAAREEIGSPVPRPDWDDAHVRDSVDAVVAADDTNRLIAVSRPAAQLLETTPDALVGHRITAIMPERYRDQHVAGFTRHLTTGEVRMIGTEVDLPVLRTDGVEQLCRVLIERAVTRDGRAVYVATMRPVPDA